MSEVCLNARRAKSLRKDPMSGLPALHALFHLLDSGGECLVTQVEVSCHRSLGRSRGMPLVSSLLQTP